MPVLPSLFFFFNDTATTEIYTLSLHDALPISRSRRRRGRGRRGTPPASSRTRSPTRPGGRSRGSLEQAVRLLCLDPARLLLDVVHRLVVLRLGEDRLQVRRVFLWVVDRLAVHRVALMRV